MEIKKSNKDFLKRNVLRERLYMKNDQRLIQFNNMSIKHLKILVKNLLIMLVLQKQFQQVSWNLENLKDMN